MNDLKVQSAFDQANSFLETAQNEMCKPEEDVVHYMVCKNAYKAVENYLTAFLLNHNLKSNPAITMEELLQECRNIESKFDNLILDIFYNAHEEEDIWMHIDTSKSFLSLAEQTKQIVIQ